MLGDAIAAKKSTGDAKETLEVVDVAQLLARSVHRDVAAVTSEPMGGDPTADGRNGSDTTPNAAETAGKRGPADEERRL